MVQIYGCGYNGFHQLDGFKNLEKAAVQVPKQITEKCVYDDLEPKLTQPRLLCQLNGAAVENVKMTWSRMAICYQRETGSYATAVSGYLLTDHKATTDNKEKGVILNDFTCQAATDTDLLFKDTAHVKDMLVLKERDVFPQHLSSSLSLDSYPSTEIDMKLVSGGHDRFHCIYNGLCFGQFSCPQDTNEKPQDVSDSPEKNKEKNSLPALVQHLDYVIPIREMSVGKEHVLLLSMTGSVYSFGLGSRGQLGHGDVEEEKSPRLIEGLEGLPVRSIAAGGWHSMALSEIGDVYVWGWNESGQLGLSTSSKETSQTSDDSEIPGIQLIPIHLEIPGDSNVKAIACGSRHTVVLTDGGDVFTCGWNGHGELGLGHTNNMDKLTPVSVGGLSGHCCQIFAGQWNSIFVCE